MRRVSVISADDRSVPARLSFKGAELTISMENPEVGESRETIAIKYGGRDLQLDFNPEYVMAPLRNVDTDAIYIEFASERGPDIFKCDLPFLYVLMPVRK
jgi:DNA polymerase-3 subunit beta